MKDISKKLNDRLDSYVNGQPYGFENQNDEFQETVIQKSKTIKKNDGLIERMDKKIIISEDNRQLLID